MMNRAHKKLQQEGTYNFAGKSSFRQTMEGSNYIIDDAAFIALQSSQVSKGKEIATLQQQQEQDLKTLRQTGVSNVDAEGHSDSLTEGSFDPSDYGRHS
jgi:hypothetical protein